MAVRRVLVLIQVFSLRSNRQAHAYKLNKKQTKSESFDERNTLSLFSVVYIMANLFQGVFTRVSEMSFSFCLLRQRNYICAYGFSFFVSLPFYIVFSFLLLSSTFHCIKQPRKKRTRFFISNSLNYYTSFKTQ